MLTIKTQESIRKSDRARRKGGKMISELATNQVNARAFVVTDP